MDCNNHDEIYSLLSTISVPDDYVLDPKFITSQQELRALLFNTAHSVVPFRVPSPQAPSNDHLSSVPSASPSCI